MDYADKPKAESRASNSNGVLEVKEPIAYYTDIGGSAVAEYGEADIDGGFGLDSDWDGDGDDGEPITPERAAAIRKDPEFIAWEQEVIRKLLEGRAATLAGHTRPFNEAIDEILRDIENGTI